MHLPAEEHLVEQLTLPSFSVEQRAQYAEHVLLHRGQTMSIAMPLLNNWLATRPPVASILPCGRREDCGCVRKTGMRVPGPKVTRITWSMVVTPRRQFDGAALEALVTGLAAPASANANASPACRRHQVVVHFHQFVHADASLITGVVAVGTAAPAPEGQRVGAFAQLGAQHGALAGIKGVRLGAAFADAPHQALRQDAAQAGGHKERRRAHVEQARDGRDRIVGVQRGQHQVAGHGGAQTDFGSLLVAHFADQNNVRVLAQHRAQHARERQVDL